MTGDEVSDTRVRLGLTRAEFAEIFLAPASTVYRWEDRAELQIPCSPLHSRILEILRNLALGKVRSAPAAQAGDTLRNLKQHASGSALLVVLALGIDQGRIVKRGKA